MSDMKWAHALVVAFVVQGCAGPPDEVPPALDAPPGQEQAHRSLASATASRALWNGCLYTLSHQERLDTTRQPPVRLHDILLHRTDAGDCPWSERSQVLDSSQEAPTSTLVANAGGLAVGHSLASGQGPGAPRSVHFVLRHVSPGTLESLRRETLTASICPRGMGTCIPGQITQAELTLSGNTLVVEGTKAGVIPGEVGEGSQFTATYPEFFHTKTAPSVIAPPDEHGSYASLEWSGCHYFVWASPTGSAGEHTVYLTRMPHGRDCPWGMESKRIDRTYRPASLALAGSSSGLAVGYRRQPSLSDDAPVSLHVLRLDWTSLRTLREEDLEVRKAQGGGTRPGALSLVHLSITPQQSLVVLGHKEGAFPGETGSPPRYQVSFEEFFNSTRSPTFGAF